MDQSHDFTYIHGCKCYATRVGWGIDERTDTTADAVRPVRTVRFAVMNLVIVVSHVKDR